MKSKKFKGVGRGREGIKLLYKDTIIIFIYFLPFYFSLKTKGEDLVLLICYHYKIIFYIYYSR